MDITRREGEMARQGATEASQQQMFNNLLTTLMAPENIAQLRMGMQQQPLSMLLSALSQTNVSPGTVSPLQLPLQQANYGFTDWLGQTLGQGISNLPLYFASR